MTCAGTLLSTVHTRAHVRVRVNISMIANLVTQHRSVEDLSVCLSVSILSLGRISCNWPPYIFENYNGLLNKISEKMCGDTVHDIIQCHQVRLEDLQSTKCAIQRSTCGSKLL